MRFKLKLRRDEVNVRFIIPTEITTTKPVKSFQHQEIDSSLAIGEMDFNFSISGINEEWNYEADYQTRLTENISIKKSINLSSNLDENSLTSLGIGAALTLGF